jgi:hypothetical protein
MIAQLVPTKEWAGILNRLEAAGYDGVWVELPGEFSCAEAQRFAYEIRIGGYFGQNTVPNHFDVRVQNAIVYVRIKKP